jgi:AMP-binding enzyme
MTNHLFKKIRAAIEEGDSRLYLETPAGFALTYAGMITLSGRYAGALAELGLKPEDRVAAQVEKSVEALILYLGGIRTGAIFLPLDTAYTSAELDYFLGDAEPKLLVCDPTRRDGSASARRLGDASYAREKSNGIDRKKARRRLMGAFLRRYGFKARTISFKSEQACGAARGRRALTSLALGLHEIATNALKYRALRAVQVTWCIEAGSCCSCGESRPDGGWRGPRRLASSERENSDSTISGTSRPVLR